MLTIRKARLTDVPALLALINDYAGRGVMLPRTEFELCENLRDFTVAIETADTADTAGPDERLAGVGRKIVDALIEEARGFQLDIVFAFTYVVAFFEKCGFLVVDRGTLPLKAWKDCVRCPKFSCCDETAMVYLLSPEALAHTQRNVNLVEIQPLSANWSISPEEPILMPMPAAGRGFQQR